jgi:ribose-phosphate pyrophosphokinase
MHKIGLQCLPDSLDAATRLASRLGVAAEPIALHRFPDGELRATVSPPASTTIIYASLNQPNEKLISLLFAAEALRRNGTSRLILVAPYLCYMRQDTAFQPFEAVSQKVIGNLLSGIVDRVITVDAHLHRTKDIRNVFPGIAADDLSAMPAIASHLQASGLDPATILLGPDEESRAWVSKLAGHLGVAFAVAKKTRQGDQSVRITLPDQGLRGRPILLVDDIVSSGGTLTTCARMLKSAGVGTIDAIVTHALFPADQTEEFARAGIRSIRSTDSVRHPTNAIPLDATLADALRDELNDRQPKELQP